MCLSRSGAWNRPSRGESRSVRGVEVVLQGTVNIDHIVVTQGGVFVVDAKRCVNKHPELKIEGGILRPGVEKLLVAGRDRTKLVDGVLGQVKTVRAAFKDEEIPVRGVLCFVEADSPMIGGTFTTRGVSVVWPRQLSKMLDGAGGEVDVQTVRDRLSEVFRPA